ncbi:MULTISPECIES: sensor histidine kinase [Paenibacillus]|uniref:histidine kinase n=1 Tax=Paenibacillus albilobatus TaxID=2716884 RepID=A0A920CAS3_9BACL|nr:MULTISPECIES: sensor histidine kinase [Paenibacillus]GIO32741.1 sensor histidine kinase [Paenibacillus albilobatus]
MKRSRFELFPSDMGFFPYVWLVYVAIPIYYISHEHWLRMAAGYLLIASFVLTYRQLFFARKSFVFWHGLQMLLLFTLSLAYSPYMLFMGFYISSFIPYYKDWRKFYAALFCFYAVLILPLLFYLPGLAAQDLYVVLPFLVVMMMSPFGMRSMYRQRQLETDLNEANERIAELVKREERLRISRDLHDTLGHTLSLITLKSQLVTRLIDRDPGKALLEAREIEQTSRAALRQVRELVSGMRTLTLTEELQASRRMLESAGIRLEAEGDFGNKEISGLVQNILGMCLKEAITNIVKHSRADRCTIAIKRTDSDIRLVISDNGVGLEGRKSGLRSDGNGLKGMKERLALIDGSLELRSSDGLTVLIRVPVVVRKTSGDGVPQAADGA